MPAPITTACELFESWCTLLMVDTSRVDDVAQEAADLVEAHGLELRVAVGEVRDLGEARLSAGAEHPLDVLLAHGHHGVAVHVEAHQELDTQVLRWRNGHDGAAEGVLVVEVDERHPS